MSNYWIRSRASVCLLVLIEVSRQSPILRQGAKAYKEKRHINLRDHGIYHEISSAFTSILPQKSVSRTV